MLYIREDIPLNLFETDQKPTESCHVELNLQNEKYLMNCSYNPLNSKTTNHPAALSKFLDLHLPKY